MWSIKERIERLNFYIYAKLWTNVKTTRRKCDKYIFVDFLILMSFYDRSIWTLVIENFHVRILCVTCVNVLRLHWHCNETQLSWLHSLKPIWQCVEELQDIFRYSFQLLYGKLLSKLLRVFLTNANMRKRIRAGTNINTYEIEKAE